MPATTDWLELACILAGLTICTTVLLRVPWPHALAYTCLTLLAADYYAHR